MIQNSSTTKKKKTTADVSVNQIEEKTSYSIKSIAEKAKTEDLDVVELMKNVYKVVEVPV